MCKKVTIVQITLKFIPTFTDHTYILLTHRIPVRLSRNSHIWYPGWRRHHVLIKYSQKCNFFVFVFNLTEVETAALKIFCVMIPSLVYTCRDFGLFREVRPYGLTTLNKPKSREVSTNDGIILMRLFQLLDSKSAAWYLYFIEFYHRCNNLSVIVFIRKYIIGEKMW